MDLLAIYRKQEAEAQEKADHEVKTSRGSKGKSKKSSGAITRASNPTRLQNLPKKRK